jgi:hypothetical protein
MVGEESVDKSLLHGIDRNLAQHSFRNMRHYDVYSIVSAAYVHAKWTFVNNRLFNEKDTAFFRAAA